MHQNTATVDYLILFSVCRTNTNKAILEHKQDKSFQLALEELRQIV